MKNELSTLPAISKAKLGHTQLDCMPFLNQVHRRRGISPTCLLCPHLHSTGKVKKNTLSEVLTKITMGSYLLGFFSRQNFM